MSNLSYLADYQIFKDKHELNHHVDQHIKRTYDDINTTARSLFKLIARYAVKYPGAAHLKVSTLAELSGVSPRTINYRLADLEELGMIKRIERMRKKSGGQGANIIVIQPCKNEEIADQIADRVEGDEVSTPTVKGYFIENEPLHKQVHLNYILETAALKNSKIPEVIKNTLQPFFSYKEIRNLAGVIFRAKRKRISIEDHEDEFRTVILDVIHRYKQGKINISLENYLYTSIHRMTRDIYLNLKAYDEVS